MPRTTAKILFLNIALSVLLSFVVFLGVGAQSTTTPKAPQINISPEAYYPLDEKLYLEGGALPKSQAELLFEKPGSNPVREVVESNSNGEWYYANRLELSKGEWMVRARVLGDPPSDWSNPRIIQARITGFVIGSLSIKFVPVAFTLVALFLLGGGLLVYSIIRVRNLRHEARERELREGMEQLKDKIRAKDREAAEIILEQNFSGIRKKILEELEHLEIKAKGGRGLSRDEEAHHAKLLHELREAEEAIQRKLKEIR